MNSAMRIRWVALSLAVSSSAAHAEWRCDCTTIVDSCAATVTVEPGWVDVTSDQALCARVDYFIDGMPFVAMVVGGEERQDWLARSENPDILIQSCQVCLDHASDAPPPTAASDDGELVPVIEVEPRYPESAALRGIEGHAEVSFTVTEFGEVRDPRIAASEPAGVFDQAALNAISRWRYTREAERAPATLTHRFTFELDSALMALSATPATATPVARQTNGQRNQCVREGVSYNYGEMIEVGLINACAEPIVVYSCAEGTGRLRSQWVCASSAERGEALVRPGDSRVGQASAGAADPDSLALASEMFVARAPNSQYWWLACNLNDNDCRTSGEQWLRSVNRQLASIDPRDRISRPLSRAN